MHTFQKTGEFGVKLFGATRQFSAVFILIFKTPQLPHYIQAGEQSGGSCHQHIPLQRLLIQHRLLFQRLDISRFHRDKHKHHFRRIEATELVIIPIRKLENTVLHRLTMLAQRQLSLVILLGIDITGISRQRGFSINHQMFLLGQINNYIRPAPAILGLKTHFALVIHPGPQTGIFQHIFQHQLTPVALGLFLALQGIG